MKHLTLVLVLFAVTATAQLSEKQLKELRDNTAKMESTTTKLNQSINESMHRMDSINMARFNEQNTRNLNAFMAQRREQEKKATTRMYWRLGFGALMLVILGIGLARKKKAKTTT